MFRNVNLVAFALIWLGACGVTEPDDPRRRLYLFTEEVGGPPDVKGNTAIFVWSSYRTCGTGDFDPDCPVPFAHVIGGPLRTEVRPGQCDALQFEIRRVYIPAPSDSDDRFTRHYFHSRLPDCGEYTLKIDWADSVLVVEPR